MSLPTYLIQDELQAFNARFREAVKSNVPLLDRIMRYVVKRKGKQIRPMFVLFSAKLCGEINETTYRAASLVELLHTASLVHDDVVDDATERRGFFSVYALWKTKASVLIGDYLLAKGLLLSLDHDDFRILQLLSEAVRKMSEGELLQMEKARTLHVKEETYYEIIKNKTASLLSSACAAGAWSAAGDEHMTTELKNFGELIGMAFQIKDDLFDYLADDVGKPTGNDIKEKKLTLPLIYTLNKADDKTRRKIIHMVKKSAKRNQDIKQVIETVRQAGGIEYAQTRMQDFYQQAKEILQKFPENDGKKGLETLTGFVINRRY